MSSRIAYFGKSLVHTLRSDPESTTRVANASLRAAGLASRFVLMIFLARFLDVASLGRFGLIYAIASMAPALLSLGLHYRLNREIIGRPIHEAASRIRDRLLVNVFFFLLAICSGLLLSLTGLQVASGLSPVLVLIFLLEMLSADLFLSLISLRRATLANVLLFIKSSSWIPLFIVAASIYPTFRTLDAVLYFWFAALVIALVVVFRQLREWPWNMIHATSIDLKWLFTDFHNSLLIYCGDLGIIGSQYIDRFIVNSLLGLSDTGVFIFYWNLSNGVQQLVATGVIQLALPKLVDAAKDKSPSEFRAVLTHEVRSVFAAAVGFALIVLSATWVTIPLLGRDIVASYVWILPALLLGTITKLVSDLLNYGVYAKKKDAQLAMINLTSAFVSALFTFVSLKYFGLVGVGIASICTATYTLVLRVYTLRGSLLLSD